MRILRTPEGGEGGNTPPVVPATPPVTPPAEPAKAPAPPAPNPLAADLAATRAELAEFKKAEADRAEQARLADEEKLKAKGDFEKLIKQRDEALAAAKKEATAATDRAKNYAMDSQLANAFSGHDLYEGSAEDLAELWRKDFEVTAEGDKWVVRAKDGRPVKDVIAERLAMPRYSNHVKATARSGANGGGGNVPAPSQTTPDGKPATYEDYLKQVLLGNNIQASPTFGLTGRRNGK